MKKLEFRKYNDLNALLDFVNDTWVIVYDSIEILTITQKGNEYTLFYYAIK